MANAYIETNEGDITLDQYEQIQYDTGAWKKDESEYFLHGSGCYIRRETYNTDFGDGARL